MPEPFAYKAPCAQYDLGMNMGRCCQGLPEGGVCGDGCVAATGALAGDGAGAESVYVPGSEKKSSGIMGGGIGGP